jgi:putative peptidoglycan lipid II flippase
VLLAPSVLRLAGPTGVVDTDEQVAVAGTLALLLVPQVFCYAVVGTCAAVMNAHRRYALAAAAPAVENVVTVGVLLAVGAAYDDTSGTVPSGELLALGVGCTAAVALHAGLQWWGARRLGVVVRPRAGWRDPEVRAVVRRAVPSIAQAGLVGVQLLAMSGMANRAVGGVVAYQIALNFFFLPIAVCATPAALALLPRMSRPEVLARPALQRDLFVRTSASALFLVVPAAAGYLALSGPLAATFSFGRLDTDYGTQLVGRALAAVSLGLVGYTVMLVGTYTCYARDDTASPLRSTALQTVVCLGLLSLVRRQEGSDVVVAVGLAYACGCSAGAVHLLRTVYRRSAPGEEALAAALARCLGSAAVMLLLVRVVVSGPDWPGGRSSSLVACLLGLAVGVVSYLGCQWLLRSPELSAVLAGARRARHRFEASPL